VKRELAAFGIFVGFGVALAAKANPIERELSTRAARSLGDAAQRWAGVTADGRDLTVSGIAPTAADRDAALDAVASTFGVRVVFDATRVGAGRRLRRSAKLATVPKADATKKADATLDTDATQKADATRAAEVDSCNQAFVQVLSGARIEFDSDSAELRGTAIIARLAEAATACGELRLTVDGHTDDSGPKLYNDRLSAARAAAVRDALVVGGVAADRIEARGWGSSRPIERGRDASSRARNRRIEIRAIRGE